MAFKKYFNFATFLCDKEILLPYLCMDKQLFVTTIPHFSETNLNSFCWFLEYGLSDELRNFASALNLNEKLNIRVYSEEFVLKRPKYSSVLCKRYDLTYAIRIYVPIELIEEGTVNEYLAFFASKFLIADRPIFFFITSYLTFFRLDILLLVKKTEEPSSRQIISKSFKP